MIIVTEADIAAMALRVPGLSRGPAAVVAALHNARGAIVPKASLYDVVEGATGIRSDGFWSVPTAIMRARRALRASGAGRIITHREIGYRLEWAPAA